MKIHPIVLAVALLFLSCQIQGQVALNGIAHKLPYAGLQPELISGVSALQATGKPVLRHVYLVDKNILALTVDEQAVIQSNQKPFIRESSDTILMEGYHGQTKILMRHGNRIGQICGVSNDWFRPFNHIAGVKMTTGWLENVSNIFLLSDEDARFQRNQYPIEIFRKSYTIDRTHNALYQRYPIRHEIYCVFQDDLLPGNTYKLNLNSGQQLPNEITFQFDDSNLRSEAIHVNLHGFMPEENKIAFLSTWLGDGGSHTYAELPTFSIVESKSGDEVYSSSTFLKQAADLPEYKIGDREYNHNLTDVLAMDFTELSTPGTYKIVVDGIGCSFDFEINENTMENISRITMKGFLHQRSGIELGPPYTDYIRPRNMHPADETTIHLCDQERFFNPKGGADKGVQTGIFDRIQASILMDTDVEEAWGGWMDAGDFDQRMTHYTTVRRMMFLYELNPSYFETYNVNIPESKNAIPDILDEARWSLDLQKRTQGIYEEGGISWWVESIEHPRQGEPSWLNSLPTALVPPTPRASLNYAATAAQMSLAVKKYDPKLAEEYLASALSAVEWVDSHPETPDLFGSYPRPVTEAMAYLNLYRATGDKGWHKKFKDMLPMAFKNGIVEDASYHSIELFVNYLFIQDLKVDKKILASSKEAIIKVADYLLAGSEESTYGVLKEPGRELNRLATFSRQALPIVIAHRITNDKKYSDALSGTMQYLLGANPMNRSYISGLGERWFAPYSIDWEANNMAMPSGIPTFGPTTVTENKWGWQGNYGVKDIQRAGLFPTDLLNWPHPERCFNQNWMAPTNEFTVSSPMGEILLISAYLAQLNIL
ncbi:MAG: glycoside hydrolase family 9 protein [Bacteroidales bacterium]|jgi:endoglucanase|nr:glycoside hydrolase family 9 protein [Bacteroidales bacterium]